MCEGVLTENGLVRREGDACRVGNDPAEFVQPFGLDGLDSVAVFESNGHLLQRDVARALADTVDRCVNEVGARGNRGERVRHAESEVVVGVGARWPVGGQLRDGRNSRIGRCVPDGIGKAEPVRTSVVGRLGQPFKKCGVGPRAILAERLDPQPVVAGVLDEFGHGR